MFLLFVGAFSSGLYGQVSELGVHYFGNNAWNSGLSISASQSRSADSIKRLIGTDKKWVEKSYQVSGGFYNDRNAYSAVFANAGFYRRRIRRNGWLNITELKPLGVYRSFLPETFRVNDRGEVSAVQLPGRFYYSPSASIGMGKYSKKRPKNYWHVDANLMLLLPYNTYVMPLVNLQVGYNFSLQN